MTGAKFCDTGSPLQDRHASPTIARKQTKKQKARVFDLNNDRIYNKPSQLFQSKAERIKKRIEKQEAYIAQQNSNQAARDDRKRQQKAKRLTQNKVEKILEERWREMNMKKKLSHSSTHHLVLEKERKQYLEQQSALRAERVEKMKEFRQAEYEKRVQKIEKIRLEKDKKNREKKKQIFKESQKANRDKKKDRVLKMEVVNKRRQEMEKEQQDELWHKLLKSYENMNRGVENSLNHLKETMTERIKKKQYWRQLQRVNSEKQMLQDKRKDLAKQMKAFKHEIMSGCVIDDLGDILPERYEASGVDCQMLTLIDAELDLTGLVWVAKLEMQSALCFFYDNTHFEMIFDQSLPQPDLRKFDITLHRNIARWDMELLNRSKLDEYFLILEQENRLFLEEKAKKDAMRLRRLKFEMKREKAKKSKAEREELEFQNRTKMIEEKTKRMQKHLQQMKKKKITEIKKWGNTRKQYAKSVEDTRKEIEKSQQEYEDRLRCFLKRKQERLRTFLEKAPKGTQSGHDYDLRLIHSVQNTDDLDLAQLQSLGIRINADIRELASVKVSSPAKKSGQRTRAERSCGGGMNRSQSAPRLRRRKSSASFTLNRKDPHVIN